jgi:purine-binding chemotaxis protein CheW
MVNEEGMAILSDEEQLVVFELADESYGVDIGAVNTIIRMQEITEIPRSPEFVEGVINLRGSIIPVIDLRKRFSLPVGEETKASRIVVVETSGQLIGMVVDAVSETLRLQQDAIEPPSPIVTSVDSEYVRGVGKLENRLVILLDLDKVLSSKELDALHSKDKRSRPASDKAA